MSNNFKEQFKQETKAGLFDGLKEIALFAIITVVTLGVFGGVGYLVADGIGLLIGIALGIGALFIAFWIGVLLGIKEAFKFFGKK